VIGCVCQFQPAPHEATSSEEKYGGIINQKPEMDTEQKEKNYQIASSCYFSLMEKIVHIFRPLKSRCLSDSRVRILIEAKSVDTSRCCSVTEWERL
jgi:hypothetical protein